MITPAYIEGLAKQVFIVEYISNGLFPCQSSVIRSIRGRKREWKFNDKFEYRMLLAGTDTGSSLNSQVYRKGASLIREGTPEIGKFEASYGTVTDGFNIDMMRNLETESKVAAFKSDFAVGMHLSRMNMMNLFKNFGIHGQFGVVHQLSAPWMDGASWRGGSSPQFNDDTVHAITSGGGTGIHFCPNAFTAASISGTGATRVPFRIKTPVNVYNSGFKAGRCLIKTKENRPWGEADVSEMYLILENQTGYLTLLSVGTTVSDWKDGQFLEITGNREVAANDRLFEDSWVPGGITVQHGPYAGTYDLFDYNGAAKYTSGAEAKVGAPEGLADLFPWYVDPDDLASNLEVRLGLDMEFRGQVSRLRYATEQAGGFIMQQQNEHIIDAVMRGSLHTKSTVPYADIGVWMNPITRQEMGYEEGEGARVIRDNFAEGKVIYERGIHHTTYQIGNQVVSEVMEDLNMPTDVIIIGPKDDISWNAWDNATADIDGYVQETWGKSGPPRIEDITVPKEFIAGLDLSKRVVLGSPELTDGSVASFSYGSRIRHPKNIQPISMYEMGALYTEYPYCYTVVKLRKPIFENTTT